MTYKPSNTQKLKDMIREYFRYQNYKCGNGYARDTISGKIKNFDIGGTKKPSSIVPAGVEFTHPVELEQYNTTALMLIKLYGKNKKWYEYIYHRYGAAPDKMPQERVGQLMCMSRQTCNKLESQIFKFLDEIDDYDKDEPRQIVGVRLAG